MNEVAKPKIEEFRLLTPDELQKARPGVVASFSTLEEVRAFMIARKMKEVEASIDKNISGWRNGFYEFAGNFAKSGTVTFPQCLNLILDDRCTCGNCFKLEIISQSVTFTETAA